VPRLERESPHLYPAHEPIQLWRSKDSPSPQPSPAGRGGIIVRCFGRFASHDVRKSSREISLGRGGGNEGRAADHIRAVARLRSQRLIRCGDEPRADPEGFRGCPGLHICHPDGVHLEPRASAREGSPPSKAPLHPEQHDEDHQQKDDRANYNDDGLSQIILIVRLLLSSMRMDAVSCRCADNIPLLSGLPAG